MIVFGESEHISWDDIFSKQARTQDLSQGGQDNFLTYHLTPSQLTKLMITASLKTYIFTNKQNFL